MTSSPSATRTAATAWVTLLSSLLLLASCPVTEIIVPSASSLSHSSTNVGRRVAVSGINDEAAVGAAIATPKLHRGARGIITNSNYFASNQHEKQTTTKTSLHMALGGNYLDDIDGNENNKSSNFRNANNPWGGFFGGGGQRNGDDEGGGGGGARGNPQDGGRTAVGSSSRTTPNGAPNGGGNNWNNNNNGRQQRQGVPKVFAIRQPQDLLDYVIQDERLSVVKVYASWCKTCQVFDTRYRKLASQLGDTDTHKGRVRFAEMRFDDPNNEEMCRLLNATKLPYILIYKGSKGKVADFQCGPAKFQMLVDAVNEFADPEGAVVGDTAAGGVDAMEAEPEWRVLREQQQKQRQQQLRMERPAASSIVDYPPLRSDDELKKKEGEISRLYSELSTLRSDFDKRIVQLKDEHKRELSTLNDRIRSQTKEYEGQRRTLTSQIDDLSRQLMEREKSYRDAESKEGSRLRDDMKRKEEEYKDTLTKLNVRITELEGDLFRKRNELRYNSNASSNDVQRLNEQVATLEGEIEKLTSRNTELEKELIEEKRAVVASSEEASRVLKQLNKIKNSEDKERRVLSARIAELEADIAEREKQVVNAGGELARDVQYELDRLKEKHERERKSMTNRIEELEEELSSWQQSSTSVSKQQRERQEELQRESKRLVDRISELEDEIDERDRLLRTANKATDILLDNMEVQKSEYEEELHRTNSLVNELEEAIANREEETEMLRERFDALEGMVEEMKQAEANSAAGANTDAANTFSFADAVRMSPEGGMEMGEMGHGLDNESEHQDGDNGLMMERHARLAAEQEVGKLMGYLRQKEEEIASMQQQQQQQGQGVMNSAEGNAANPNNNMFPFGSLFGGSGGGNAAEQYSSWDENYQMLKDVLMPDEVSPREGQQQQQQQQQQTRSGAGRVDNIREGAPPPHGGGTEAGIGQQRSVENIWEGAGGGGGRGLSSLMGDMSSSDPNTPSPAAANPAPAGLPTPAMAFERRLAENPIVPAGAFGGKKPTASFFSKSNQPPGESSAPPVPSDTPDYYQSVISNFHSNENDDSNSPAMPPISSFGQRPTTPVARTQAMTGMTENIYAGAGSVSSGYSGSSSTTSPGPSPSVIPREEQPTAPLPTPAMAFERRIAENPIVPQGAFGNSRPTANFFSPKPSPPAASSDSSQSAFSEEDDPQSKWQTLDETEKKRVAAEAYRAFEKSLEDGRRQGSSSAGSGGIGSQQPNKGRQTVSPTVGASPGSKGGGDGSKRTAAASTTTTPTSKTNQQSQQLEQERKKHQEMVKAAASSSAASKEQQRTVAKSSAPGGNSNSQQQQQKSTRQIQMSAMQASAKRMSLAERAAKADQDRKEKEKRIKAEARKSQEVQINDTQRAEEATKAEEDNRKEEIRKAEDLKRKADADLENAKKAIEAAEKAAKQQQEEIDPDKRSREPEPAGGSSLDTKEMVEAALLGAEEEEESNASADDSRRRRKMRQEEKELRQSAEAQKQKKTTAPRQKKKLNRAASSVGGNFKYDVVVLNPKNATTATLDVPQLLEGSLKDLLNKEKPKRRRGRNQNY